ncbi:MAG: Fe-S cluster assembly ATPase SufC [Candidatus Moraniibacteriota bacterium]
MLELKNLSASIEGQPILSDVSYTFASGSTTALLGPNGSGKSTLAASILGHPSITLSENADILFDGQSLKDLSPDKRARLGLFLSFQNPLPLSGVSLMDMLRVALLGEHSEFDALTLHKTAHLYAEELGIPKELLKRSLYEGFSGGEKKKVEALQAALFAPRFAIFDEIDTGVDVDALKKIVAFLKAHLPEDSTLVFITHSHKLLNALGPDHVVVLKDGRVVKTGEQELAENIEQNGFSQF